MHGEQTMNRVNNHNVLYALGYSIGEPVRIESMVEGKLTSIVAEVSHNDPRTNTLQAGNLEFRKSDGQCTSGANVSIKAIGKYARVADREEIPNNDGAHANHDTEGQFAIG